tara:strand:+ start:398 stop:682 length:285 start_codon:yes stop_codon:yes gene_type:complete
MKQSKVLREATGTIDELVNHFVRQAGWFDDLHSNMKLRIEVLQDLGDEDTATELIDLLKSVNAWWDPSMEDLSRQHSPETCFNLRKYSADKLGR